MVDGFQIFQCFIITVQQMEQISLACRAVRDRFRRFRPVLF